MANGTQGSEEKRKRGCPEEGFLGKKDYVVDIEKKGGKGKVGTKGSRAPQYRKPTKEGDRVKG